MTRDRALAIGLFLLSSTLRAEQIPPGDLATLDHQLGQLFGDAGVPGASVAIVENGGIAFVKGYGLADTTRKTPATADTPFRAGSISKNFTAIALMTLVEQHKLSLDARVSEAAPDVRFENAWEATSPLRLVHLLEHTSGWPDIGTRVLSKDDASWTTLDGVRFASGDFVSRWPPGRFMVYCNAGAGVVGVAIERASGRAFDDYVRDAVLRPLGMSDADFSLPPELARAIAKSYDRNGAETPYQHIVLKPAGSLNISARELAQLVRFYLGRGTLDGRTILSPESVARIERSETNLAATAGFTYGYGLGMAPVPSAGVTFRGHNGGIDSFTAVLAYSERANAGYVLMANGGRGVDFGEPAAQLVQRYLARNMALAPQSTRAVNRETLARYAGFYRNVTPPNALLRPYVEMLGWTRVSAADGKLRRAGHDWLPVSAQLFRRDDREEPSVAFVEDGGRTYAVGAFNASVKAPVWIPLIAMAVVGAIGFGAIVGVVMIGPWFIALARGRLRSRGGALVRIVPFAGVVTLAATLAIPIKLFTSSPSSVRPLAEIGPWSLAVFVGSLLVPALALCGLALARRSKNLGRFVRAYAAITSLGLLAAAGYLAAIGWLGARTWRL